MIDTLIWGDKDLIS